MKDQYDDIINLPHHVSATRPQMSISDRAAQFSPFSALVGYDDAIKKEARLTDEQLELGEETLNELNQKLQFLSDYLGDEQEVNTHTFSRIKSSRKLPIT